MYRDSLDAPLDGAAKLADEIRERLKQVAGQCGDPNSDFSNSLSKVQDEILKLRARVKILERDLRPEAQKNLIVKEILSLAAQSETEIKSLRNKHEFLISLRNFVPENKEALLDIQEDALLEQGYQLSELKNSILKQKNAGEIINEELCKHKDIIDNLSRHAQNLDSSINEGNKEIAEKSLLSKCSDYYRKCIQSFA